MSQHPPSVVAERAVRYLHASGRPASSIVLARELLSLTVGDEARATRVLGAAFAHDPRLAYDNGAWHKVEGEPAQSVESVVPIRTEPDIAFVLVEGLRPVPGARFELAAVVASRRRNGEIVEACGGLLATVPPGSDLKIRMREILRGARVVVAAPPGGLTALEAWIEEPIEDPLPLQLLARRRLGRPGLRDPETIAAAIGLHVTVEDDPASRVDLVPFCFDALRGPGETWAELAEACRATGDALPWSRYAFTRDDLTALPASPGTYRFYDLDDRLLYVGKSKNLRRRLASWFAEPVRHGTRSLAIVTAVHRFEAKPSGSELTALLREASQIRRHKPVSNVQRAVHASKNDKTRLLSILILEPAESPWLLRAWLIRDGCLLDSVALGPKGGGLRRIERILRDEFFDRRPGPRSQTARPVDIEIVKRWLSENRDKAVAFDPTHLKSVDDVIVRLRWFLERGALRDPEGSPILPR